jgi:hypothetical protein
MAAPLDFLTELDLTFSGQDRHNLPRLYPGDTVRWRFQVLDEADAAVDLTGYHIALTARRKKTADAAVALSRSTAADIVGASPASKQIKIDADQSVDDVETYTGRGWFEVRFYATVDEEAKLVAAIGQSYFDLVLEAPDGTTTTFAEGLLEVQRRMTRVADVP